ncbi:hypothetical protein NDU88_002828 [Pleurodeles waltl]|uniref:Uncharacterized protein n=1 Tax=Pleurodeles waltl TaxID=8319 RepID=A0AAV7M1S6_PLEWA|nr:hypothetical protein NDU88_002828 [Pleurodeles waltl]
MPALDGPEPRTPERRRRITQRVLGLTWSKGAWAARAGGAADALCRLSLLPDSSAGLFSARLRAELCLPTVGSPTGAPEENRLTCRGVAHARWLGGGRSPSRDPIVLSSPYYLSRRTEPESSTDPGWYFTRK